MLAPATMLKRLLIVVHRWLGVALAAVFLLWFASGIVMMYWTFPDVSTRDRLERAPELRADTISLTPEAAYAILGRDEPPGDVRLTTFDGRPVYSFGGGFGSRGGASMVYADNGAEQLSVDARMLDRVAEAWSGRPASQARRELVEDVDQWTVGNARSRLPLLKYSWPDGQQLYIDENTAEIVQYTTASSRFWAYLGAIPHWFYFTPLRKHGPEWFSAVVWSSLIGTVAALMGVVIAIWMYSPGKRYRHAGAPTAIPYRGWKRWHTILGLLFGVVTTTWTFSGLLSMGPFPITDRLVELTVPPETTAQGEAAVPGRRRGGRSSIEGALRGSESFAFASYAARTPAEAVAALDGFEVKELELSRFAGQPVYFARNGSNQTRIVPMTGASQERFDTDDVIRVVREAAGDRLAELRVMDEYDAYYLDRHGDRPLPVVYARMNDAISSRYYIDPGTARVVGQYNARNWVSRWLYRGLHSLDFPWLYKYRPLWDIVVISLMLGGTLLCMTSIVLAWRVLVRKLAVLVRARMAPVREDLIPDT